MKLQPRCSGMCWHCTDAGRAVLAAGVDVDRRAADALIGAGLLHHGPNPKMRNGREDPGPPWASAAPITWAEPLKKALREAGLALVVLEEA